MGTETVLFFLTGGREKGSTAVKRKSQINKISVLLKIKIDLRSSKEEAHLHIFSTAVCQVLQAEKRRRNVCEVYIMNHFYCSCMNLLNDDILYTGALRQESFQSPLF